MTIREEVFTTGPVKDHIPQPVYQHTSLHETLSRRRGWTVGVDDTCIYQHTSASAFIYPLSDPSHNGYLVSVACGTCYACTDGEHITASADDSPQRVIDRARKYAEHLAEHPDDWHTSPCRPQARPF